MIRLKAVPLTGYERVSLPAWPVASWFVCFEGDDPSNDSPQPFIWRLAKRLTRPGFRHVFALGYCPRLETWLCVDTRLRWTEITIVTATEADCLLAGVRVDGGSILRLTVAPPGLGVWRPRGLLYCVSSIKHLLGVRGFAATPQGLYRRLVRDGARVVVERGELRP